MKILIYGTGVIGCTYGWQLAKAGHDMTVLVRQGKKTVSISFVPTSEENKNKQSKLDSTRKSLTISLPIMILNILS